MKQKIISASYIVVAICFALIVAAMTLDWITKYTIYLQQRDELHRLINARMDIEAVKSTVSYLQGAATRQLNKLKDVSIVFGLAFASFSLYIKLIKRG
ncbi:hypothetical protein EHV15_05065 [Paenibacillus oralis]|uniref:Uncharacterized protein n=1 Tax=Paenibacillus oralis TaxID=2490856 RepID=A0A3P3TX35_9BACL|nr:hypothetical protein [Paenibacillus oralis]RRJ62390.1 hypothetical protein EHV15_05065 [Paenibacillus oralis]